VLWLPSDKPPQRCFDFGLAEYVIKVYFLMLPKLCLTPPVLGSTSSCKLKLDEEKSKYACFTQQNGFAPNIFTQFAEANQGSNKV
jgi:hypothetical protein